MTVGCSSMYCLQLKYKCCSVVVETTGEVKPNEAYTQPQITARVQKLQSACRGNNH